VKSLAFKNIILEKKDHIAKITMNRPDALNALNMETRMEFLNAIEDVQNDDDVRVLIITGEGRAFVAGSDIKELKDTNMLQARKVPRLGEAVENLEKPVIAAVNGFALGGGCEIAMACDIIVASETAKFGQPEINLGVIPGGGGTQRLPSIVGPQRAKELIFTGDLIDAKEAERIGLVNRVVPASELDSVVRSIAEKIAVKSPVATRLAKAAINRGLRSNLETGLAYEKELYAQAQTTEDKTEGIAAFLEKRKPVFKGMPDRIGMTTERNPSEVLTSKEKKQVPVEAGLFTWPSSEPRLIGSRCRSCGTYSFPKSYSCPNPDCDVKDVEEVQLSGRGKLASYTIQRYNPPLFKMEPFRPFAIGLVELPEGINVLGILTTTDNLKIGMALEMVVEGLYTEGENEVVTWKFKPIQEGERK
jgi:enoyl-CoA hydratase